MYGMLLESIQHFIQTEHGETKWLELLEASGSEHTVFNTQQIYPDHLIGDLATVASQLLGKLSPSGYMRLFGRYFVKFFSNFGYEKIVRATGRYFTDFLQNVDNIHLQMRFSYPKMESPSMYLCEVDSQGAILVYRSSRTGFREYFIGIILEIAECLYDIQLEVIVLEELQNLNSGRNVQLKLRLNFDNERYMCSKRQVEELPCDLPSVSTAFLEFLFPYTVLFGPSLRVLSAGDSLLQVFRGTQLIGKPVTNIIKLRRPKGIDFTWANIINYQNVMFEAEVLQSCPVDQPSTSEREFKNIILSGQMKLIEPVMVVIFLCSPSAKDLSELADMGLSLENLNPNGLAHELLTEESVHASRLDEMRRAAEKQCNELEGSQKQLRQWKEKGDKVLYSMIPRPVAEQLKAGQPPLSTCKDFDEVTIMFTELSGLIFTDNIDEVLEVVKKINIIFIQFDKIVEEFNVYKVETVGEVYMAVSGAPEPCPFHGASIAKFSLRLRDSVEIDVSLRIGIHSGPVAGGVVGTKVPRYCLFGDTVNTASRMQSTSLPGKIQISPKTNEILSKNEFSIEPRGTIFVKGKGHMTTYWLKELRQST